MASHVSCLIATNYDAFIFALAVMDKTEKAINWLQKEATQEKTIISKSLMLTKKEVA